MDDIVFVKCAEVARSSGQVKYLEVYREGYEFFSPQL